MKSSLPGRILQVRLALGLTQKQLSERVASGRVPTVSNWETGEKKPPRNTLWALACLFEDPELVMPWLEGREPHRPALRARSDALLKGLCRSTGEAED